MFSCLPLSKASCIPFRLLPLPTLILLGSRNPVPAHIIVFNYLPYFNRQTFTGNTDNKGRKKNQVNIQARYIRFLPRTWNDGIGMRVELYGCSIGKYARIISIRPQTNDISVLRPTYLTSSFDCIRFMVR